MPNAPQNPAHKISGTPIIPYPPSLSSAPTDRPGTSPNDLPQAVPTPKYSAGFSLPSTHPSGPTAAVSGSIELQTPDDAPHSSGPVTKHPAGPHAHQDRPPAPPLQSLQGGSAPTDLLYVAPPPNASASAVPPANGPPPTNGTQPPPSPTSTASADGTRSTGLLQGDPTPNHEEPSSPTPPAPLALD
ncbi:uncharacterized protein LACBIDRAFT_312271 [Laccaria bicolor S238N-H82]|uniref:Predicted protein n=1 Tax=Laccaria bicolor (strain S238N-H82 / ATCC MYA-4686) TaxID=486041 RepID=B0DVV2_LACBS|nr:uncharacterized protein LACBIDRAFT_312271 [Laccaria bicolor S238N-H82]EDR01364.1 predicted protein [Laccaria bicolor S238N-H82]|eukprot:XP_001888071.1 predicted protein [Laccaria bicolor S238N-H82]